jgi:hypothetical protein
LAPGVMASRSRRSGEGTLSLVGFGGVSARRTFNGVGAAAVGLGIRRGVLSRLKTGAAAAAPADGGARCFGCGGVRAPLAAGEPKALLGGWGVVCPGVQSRFGVGQDGTGLLGDGHVVLKVSAPASPSRPWQPSRAVLVGSAPSFWLESFQAAGSGLHQGISRPKMKCDMRYAAHASRITFRTAREINHDEKSELLPQPVIAIDGACGGVESCVTSVAPARVQ